jgi:hypothetical protein
MGQPETRAKPASSEHPDEATETATAEVPGPELERATVPAQELPAYQAQEPALATARGQERGMGWAPDKAANQEPAQAPA